MDDITRVLNASQQGDGKAAEELLPLLYAELRKLAASKMAREAPGQTIQATALVHEAWLVLGDGNFQNRAHFFAAAAETMRRLLVDRARRKHAIRHGGGQARVELTEEIPLENEPPSDEVLAVHEALDELAGENPEKAQLVKLRYFSGFTIEEAASVLGISEPTAKRWWAYARAWLHEAIKARVNKG